MVADLRAGRVCHPSAVSAAPVSQIFLRRARLPQPVVDCTEIFNAQLSLGAINLYDDYPQVISPWDDAMLCYQNTFGNVVVMQVHRYDFDGTVPSRDKWRSNNSIDWTQIKWISETGIWVGGKDGDGKDALTFGPCHIFRHAINEDGSPGDVNWVDPSGKRIEWNAALVTLSGALNFLNATNVDIAEPSRPRPSRRRLERIGVRVQTIVVRPPGKRRIGTGAARPLDASEAVFSPIRGHWARYGVEGREGLLFGKYAGKFWIPARVRGVGGDDQSAYVLKPGRGTIRS